MNRSYIPHKLFSSICIFYSHFCLVGILCTFFVYIIIMSSKISMYDVFKCHATCRQVYTVNIALYL